MTTLNLLCLGGGALIGAASVILLAVFLSNRHLPTDGQERDDAAFGPTDHPLDRPIGIHHQIRDDWRQS